ncbi:unnamed protein product [Musa banksii]
MGNCLDLQKPVTWVDDEDDDWGSMESRSPKHYKRQRKAGAEAAKEKASSGSTEIKIKISKKQLEKLLRQADDGEKLPLRRFIADLVSMGDHTFSTQMGFLRSHCSYSRVDKEDPEERQHLKARFLIYRTLEEADTRQRRSSSRLRACRSKRKIGLKLKRLRVPFSRARRCVYRQVVKRFRHLNLFLVTQWAF